MQELVTRDGLVLRRSLITGSLPAMPEVSHCFACPRVTATPRCSPVDRARSGHARNSVGRPNLWMRIMGGWVARRRSGHGALGLIS